MKNAKSRRHPVSVRHAARHHAISRTGKRFTAPNLRRSRWRVTVVRGERRRAAFAKNIAKRDAAVQHLKAVAAAARLIVWGQYEDQDSRLSYMHASPTCPKAETAFTAAASKLARGQLACGCNRRAAGARRALDISAATALAEARSGRLVSATYNNNRDRLTWECADGHHFDMSYSDAAGGRWCPRCADCRANILCKVVLDRLLAVEFEQEQTPKFLADAGDAAGLRAQLRFDGWCKAEAIAFEHQGPHHFAPLVRNKTADGMPDTTAAKVKFERGLHHDAIKCHACIGAATLIVIDDISAKGYAYAQAAGIIETIILAVRGALPVDRLGSAFETAASSLRTLDERGWRELITPIFLGRQTRRRLEAVAKDRGGRLIAIVDDRRASFECAEGHQWEAQINNVIAGTWCPVAGVEKRATPRRLTIPQLFARLEILGLRLDWNADEAQQRYRNNRTPLPVIRIACGGRFTRPLAKLHAGSRCPGCKNKIVCTGRGYKSRPKGRTTH
jgi:hypothetical protein